MNKTLTILVGLMAIATSAFGVDCTVASPTGIADQTTLNVKDYGATGDGTTNDRPCIQAAIDDADDAGHAVHFPPGVYLIDVDSAHS
ncbi:MAG: glycoside hydrolase family 55 protein [Thermoanaerobaculia bacterium]|nr:glycoside hydrolase family 55 protein [Thermoanaerobaculia bacterium]